MKIFKALIAACWLCSCTTGEVVKEQAVAIPAKRVALPSKDVSLKGDTVFYQNKKYSGFLYRLDSASKDTISMEGYLDGLLSGTLRKWYSKGHLLEERQYLAGKKNGRQLSLWESGKKRFEFTARNDAYEGKLREWNVEGRLVHLATYANGQEEGTQRLWYDDGKVRANYVIINGKRYGLLGTKNCKNVSDSIFVVK